MKKIFFSIAFFLIGIMVYSQEHKSIHQQQQEYYSQFNAQTPDEWAAIRGECKPNNRKSEKSCTLNKIVFGWHPYWSNGLEANYDWSLLTDLSYFCYAVDPSTGNATTTNSWSTANAVTQALAHGVRVNLCVTLFSNHATFFGSSSAQQTLITNLINLVSARGANGVNIDFEAVPSSQATNFTNFLVNLCTQFHSQMPGSQVSIALYSVDWSSVFDIATLKDYIDLFVIMGYDYYYSGSSTAGPSSPLYSLTSSYDYNVSKSITYYLSAGVPPQKLILGLPYYGEEWATSSSSVPSSTTATGSSKIYNTVRNNASGYYSSANFHFNTNSYVPYFAYNNGSSWYQCWIDNAYSLGKKMELVWKRGIGGIGIWALGYDDGYPDLWNKINEKLTTCFTNACQDTIYDMGGPAGNYYNKENYSYTIQPIGASSVTLNFQSFNVEANYDSLWLYDGPSTASPLIGAYTGTNGPGSITSTQPAMTLRFKSDNATVSSGFTAYWQCNIDNIAPTTAISTLGTWKTQDFTANFTDNDNIALDKCFYQVLDFNGQYWGANSDCGFFGDNFDTLNSYWHTYSGTWAVTNGELIQSDESVNNTNIYTAVNQNLSNRYLYHFLAKAGGSSTNKRFGFHFFCDSANFANRHNSYFIWFRMEDQQLQFYKVINDTFVLKNTVYNITTNANQTYDFKITYDRISGKIALWRDNVYLGSWIDTIPYSTNGNYISFRSGNCTLNVTELKVYRSRYPSVTITMGDSTKFIRYQNSNPSTPSARIKSIVVDVNNNFSSIEYENENVDWTPPIYTGSIADGLSTDVDTITSLTSITANWQSFDDVNSGIAEYWYSVGTQAGDSNTVTWTDNGLNTYFTASALLQAGVKYYVNIKAKNNAGLWSTIQSSDGAIVLPNGNLPYALFSVSDSIICSGDNIQFHNYSLLADSVLWLFTGATPSQSSNPNPTVIYNSAGTYDVTLVAYNANGTDTLVKHNYITVYAAPAINVQYHIISSQAPYYVVFDNQSQNMDSVLWNFGDGQTSTDVSPYHLYAQNGTYIVTMQAYNAHCTSVYIDTINLNTYVYPEINDMSISVFPNPAKDKITLISTDEKIMEVEIQTITGDCLINTRVNSNKTEISLKNMNRGTYLLHIKTKSKQWINFKIVKQ